LVAPTASAARRVSIRMSALLANDARAGFDLSSAIQLPEPSALNFATKSVPSFRYFAPAASPLSAADQGAFDTNL
jgi:hypothetical protein